MQVLDAVQYAHANLVIHRDLKPGNVLVNAQGKALLLDFGIAKILEEDSSEANESELTRLGGRALTLHYAAPEQIKGEGVSIATDIWALGVLLYELLTGLRPFDGAGRNGLEASVLNAEPIRPNSRRSGRMTELSSGLASDLDTIVLKAIKKAVPDRYATVNAFSEDLTRWLKGEAVLAQPDSRWYRTRKFVGRNRLAVLSGVVAFLLVTSTATLAIIMGLRAGEEAGRATAARDFQIDMFRQANTDLTQGEEISARQLLVQGRKTILNTLDSQPLLRNELLNGIAEAQIGIEQWADADESLTLLSAFMLASGKPRDAAMTTLDRAEGAVEKGDFARVMAILSEAQSIYPEYAADEFFLVRLLIFEVAEAHFKADQASVHELLNSVRPMAVRVLNGTDRRQLFAIRLLAEIESGVGDFLQASNRLNDLLSRLSEGKKTAPNAVLGVLDDLAQLEIYAGRFHTAMILYETANGHCAHDLDPNGRQCTLTQLHRINNLLFLGYFDDAMKALPPVLASVRFRKSTDSLGAATLQAYSTLLKNNKLDQYPDVSMHLSLLTTSGESDKSHTSIRVNGLLLEVEKLIRQQQPKNAELVLIKAENELVSNKLGYARFAARIKLFRGIIANALGNPETAISIMQEGVKILGNETGFDHPLTLMMTINQANALSRINQKEKALALIDYALPVLQDALGLTAPIFLKIKAMRAEIANSPSQKSKFQNELFFL
jgi:tetratricopeptide (TPR) repeat protein